MKVWWIHDPSNHHEGSVLLSNEMSVYFVYVRIELESHQQKPLDFEFLARPLIQCTDSSFFYNSKSEFLDAVVAIRGHRELGPLTIETYDPDSARQAMEGIPPNERPIMRPRTSSCANSESSENQTETKANEEFCVQFYYGNPSVEMVKGILHLFRDKPEILRLKIIRDKTAHQYMVLIRLRTQEAADLFYDHFNGVPFTCIETGICHLAYVARVDAVEDIEGGGMPVDGVTELPTCAFCLERMDEAANGILTILCNHSFHSACLQQWGDMSCPVCRYFQTPQMAEEQTCVQCGISTEDLWLCLICGNVGCGRYSAKHAFVHFQQTQHTYALNLKTQRVWDYVGDGYVHRLIQSSGADKMVEVQAGTGHLDEKMESITLEYTYLLTTQLESQRHYFEERLEDLARENEENLKALRYALECRSMETADFGQLRKEKDSVEKKLQVATTRLVKLTKDFQVQQQENSCLHDNLKDYKVILDEIRKEKEAIIEEKEREITDLKEQLADLMVHMQAQDRIAELPEGVRQDIEGGNLFTARDGRTPISGTRRSNNSRRRHR